MKNLLRGIAFAALLAAGAPVGTQAAAPVTGPIIPPADPAAAQAAASAAAASPAAASPAAASPAAASPGTAIRHDRAMHRRYAWRRRHAWGHAWGHTRHHTWRGGRSDRVAEQLNTAELNRVAPPPH